MNSIRFVLGEQRYLEFEIRPRRARHGGDHRGVVGITAKRRDS